MGTTLLLQTAILDSVRKSFLPNGIFIADRCTKFIPEYAKAKLLTPILNHAFKQQLADGELEHLEGKRFGFTLTGQTPICIGLLNGKFCAQDDWHCLISAEPQAVAALICKNEDPDALFFNRQLLIEGETELGLEIKHLLDNHSHPQWLARCLALLG